MVGNLGRRLYNTWNSNQPLPGAAALYTRRPYYTITPDVADISFFASDGLSNYYAGQLTIDKRFTKGVSALVGYWRSHAIDNVVLEFGGGAVGPQPQDPRNQRVGARGIPSSICATALPPATFGNCLSGKGAR